MVRGAWTRTRRRVLSVAEAEPEAPGVAEAEPEPGEEGTGEPETLERTRMRTGPRAVGMVARAHLSEAGCGWMLTRVQPGSRGWKPMRRKGRRLPGAAPQAWFQSWLGLKESSQASRVRVEPTRSMLYQLRRLSEDSRLKA